MPMRPLPAPLMSRLRRITTAPEAFTLMPLVPAASIPERPVMPSIVIDLVMVTEPKPPGSSASISPAAAVLEIAPAKVLQGAVRLHGLASSPTPETHVRVAWAWATGGKEQTAEITEATAAKRTLVMTSFLCWLLFPGDRQD